MGNPRYPLELFQKVVTVSIETMKIVRALPKLEILSVANREQAGTLNAPHPE